MHYLQNVSWQPSLVGTIYNAVSGDTWQGAPVQVDGFSEAKLLVIYSAAKYGTAANVGSITLKVQQSATLAGTGSEWTDITDGEVMGSFKVTASITHTGTPWVGSTSAYERIVRGTHKKFLRLHATLGGTAGTTAYVAAGFLLGNPISTLYITNPTSMGTGNADFRIIA